MNIAEATDIKIGNSSVSAVYLGSLLLWPLGEEATPLTIEAMPDLSGTITFLNKASNPVYYKVNGGAEQTIASNTTGSINVSGGDIVQFFGNNRRYCTNRSNPSKINCTCYCYVYGNAMSLISKSRYVTLRNIFDTSENYLYALGYLFLYNTHILNHPDKDVLLPDKTAPRNGYENMFLGCSNITRTPKLAATTFGEWCCLSMFYNCTSLSTAYDFVNTSSAQGCFASMFNGCRSLTKAPALPATSLSNYCYQAMFAGCTRLTTAQSILPATSLKDYCYYGMFAGCTSLTTAPAISATTLASNCCREMFSGCTRLISAPQLNVTTLASACYNSMFNNCTSLTTAPALPATTLASSCYNSMFKGCSSLTSAPLLPATTLATSCYESMFNGCTSLTSAPLLPATYLKEKCYRYMFSGCTSLTTAYDFPTLTCDNSACERMFNGCTSLTNTPKINFTIVIFGDMMGVLGKYACSYMFCNCDAITSADVTITFAKNTNYGSDYSLGDYCKYMFFNCDNLNNVTFRSTLFDSAYFDSWLAATSATGTFKCSRQATIPTGTNGIPSGWTVQYLD